MGIWDDLAVKAGDIGKKADEVADARKAARDEKAVSGAMSELTRTGGRKSGIIGVGAAGTAGAASAVSGALTSVVAGVTGGIGLALAGAVALILLLRYFSLDRQIRKGEQAAAKKQALSNAGYL